MKTETYITPNRIIDKLYEELQPLVSEIEALTPNKGDDIQQAISHRAELVYRLANKETRKFIDAAFFEIFSMTLFELLGKPDNLE